MNSAINTTIDAAGRMVIPKTIRELAGLRAGMSLEVVYHAGRIEIEPSPREVTIVKKGSLCVATPKEPSPPLTEETVQCTRDAIRSRKVEK